MLIIFVIWNNGLILLFLHLFYYILNDVLFAVVRVLVGGDCIVYPSRHHCIRDGQAHRIGPVADIPLGSQGDEIRHDGKKIINLKWLQAKDSKTGSGKRFGLGLKCFPGRFCSVCSRPSSMIILCPAVLNYIFTSSGWSLQSRVFTCWSSSLAKSKLGNMATRMFNNQLNEIT